VVARYISRGETSSELSSIGSGEMDGHWGHFVFALFVVEQEKK